MLRGELSNSPAPIIAIDWRILIEAKPLSFGRIKYLLKEGAMSWIERQLAYRMTAILVGEYSKENKIKRLLETIVSEVIVFKSAAEAVAWVRRSPEVLWIYTNDSDLLGLGDCFKTHGGWHERPETWITVRH